MFLDALESQPIRATVFKFLSLFLYCFLIVCTCVHVMMFAIEGEQFESGFEAEAEEPLPEIFEQQEFVPEGKSCSTP